MDSRKLLKNKILNIEKSLDDAFEIVSIGYVKDVNEEINLKLTDLIEMVSGLRNLLSEKVI